ncbi:MAG: hypothetical protein ACFFC3_09195 [Candidatus Odinarchaeota archaeon]
MPKSGEFNREKYKVIIYHGHIHILANKEELEDRVSSHNKKIINSDLFLNKKELN